MPNKSKLTTPDAHRSKGEVRIALVGCGRWGKNLARNLFSIGALCEIVDSSPDAIALAQTLGVSHGREFAAVLADSSIDAVALATPAALHFIHVNLALTAGKHVFVEKPLALNIQEAEDLAERAEAADLVLMVGHLLQYNAAYRELVRLVEEGEIGQVRHISSSRMNLGAVRHEENVLWSFLPHDVSMVLGLTSSPPRWISACGNAFVDAAVPDICTVQIGFADGTHAECRGSWVHPEKEQKLVVVGDKAMATFDDRLPWAEKLKLAHYAIEYSGVNPMARRGEDRVFALPENEPLRAEMTHFADCVAGRSRPRTGAEEAIAVLRILAAAQRSLDRRGATIDV